MYKSVSLIYLIASNCVLGSFLMGYALGYLNVCLSTFNKVFQVAEYYDLDFLDGIIQALLPVGAAIGSTACGPMLNIFSRRHALIITDVVSIIGFSLAQIISFPVLIISRVVIGMAVGLNSTLVPLYIKEYTPVQMRGSVGSLNQILLNVGLFTAFTLGLYFKFSYSSGLPSDHESDSSFWRVILLIPIATSLIRTFVLLKYFKLNPATYYMGEGNIEKVTEVLSLLYKTECVPQQLNELEWEYAQMSKQTSTYQALLRPPYLKRFIVGCLLNILKQFSGINSIIFYSSQLFFQILKNAEYVKYLNVGIGLTNILISAFSGYLMKKFGRQSLLLVGDVICLICLISQTIFIKYMDFHPSFPYLAVVSLYFFNVGFQFSFGPIVWIYLAEILPEKGLSISILVNWMCVALVTLTFPVMSHDTQNYFYTGICCIGFFFIIYMIKETKGRNAISIDNLYYPQQKQSLVLNDHKLVHQETDAATQGTLLEK